MKLKMKKDSDSTVEGGDTTAEATTEARSFRIDHEILNHRIR